nr:hypothetical protein [Tanacetum cinerariifolium]
MTSFGYRFNPRYAIKECSSCGTLYTRNYVCSIGTVEDKILVPKPPKNCARCTRCGYLVDGPNYQGCALLRQELKENLVTYSPDFQNSSEPSNASTNVVNAPRETYVVKQDNGSFVDKIIFRAPDSPNQFHCFHCKDVLSISETSSQSPPNINHCCYECGDPLDGIFCKRCTCKSCGKDAHIGYNCPTKVLVISNPEPCNNQTIDELLQTLPIFHPTFQSEAESPFTLDSTPTYVDESPNVFNPPPQSSVYPCEFCGNDAYYGHYYTPQAPFIYSEPCYNQDFNFLQDFQNVPQQYPCCDDCEVTHDAHQCQPMNEVYDYGQNYCYDSTSIGFDQAQPQQYTVDHPIFNAHNSYLDSQIQLNSTLAKIKDQMTSITSLCKLACQVAQKKLKEKQIEEERAAKAKYWKLPVCYDNDHDEERSNSLDDNIISGLPPFSAITPDEPVLSTEEPDNSLSMGDEHLDTISAMESDEFIKSDQIEDLSESNEEFSLTDDDSFSLDNIDYVEASPPNSKLVSSEVMEIVIPEVDAFLAVEDEFTSSQFPKSYLDPEGDMILFEEFLIDDHSSDFKTKSSSTSLNSILEETNNFHNSLPEFTTFSKVLFDAECKSDSEIIPMKFLRTHDSSLPILSKIDSLLDEFAGELTLLKSIPPRIDETDCDFEEDIRLIEKLLYDNSSSCPSKEFVSANYVAKIKSFSPSPILVKDSDSLMEEIDLFCTPDYPMSPGIMDKDYDSERDILIRKDLPSNNTRSFVEKESIHFDIPSFSRPPAKPPDVDTRILNI